MRGRRAGKGHCEAIVILPTIIKTGKVTVSTVIDDSEDVDQELFCVDTLGACPWLAVEDELTEVLQYVLAEGGESLLAVEEGAESVDDRRGESVEPDAVGASDGDNCKRIGGRLVLTNELFPGNEARVWRRVEGSKVGRLLRHGTGRCAER